MLLRKTVDRFLPVDERLNERRLSPEARAVVFRGAYYSGLGVVRVDSQSRSLTTGPGPKTVDYGPTTSVVRIQAGEYGNRRERGVGRQYWYDGLPQDAIDELQSPASLTRANHVEAVATRVKGGLAALLGILVIGAPLVGDAINNHDQPARSGAPDVTHAPSNPK